MNKKKRNTIAIFSEETAGVGGVVFTLHNIARMLEKGYRVDVITGTHNKFRCELHRFPEFSQAIDRGDIVLSPLPCSVMEDDAASLDAQQAFLENHPDFQKEHKEQALSALRAVKLRGDKLDAILYVKSLNRMRYWIYDDTLEAVFSYAKTNNVVLATENRANSDDFHLGLSTERLTELHNGVDCFFVCSDPNLDKITTHSAVARALPQDRITYIGYKAGSPTTSASSKPPTKQDIYSVFFSPGGTWISQYEDTYYLLIDACKLLRDSSERSFAKPWILTIPENAPEAVEQRITSYLEKAAIQNLVQLRTGHIPKEEFDDIARSSMIAVTSGGHTSIQLASMKDGPRICCIPLQQGKGAGEQMLAAVNLHFNNLVVSALKGETHHHLGEALKILCISSKQDGPCILKTAEDMRHALERTLSADRSSAPTIMTDGAHKLVDMLEAAIQRKSKPRSARRC